MTIQIKQSSDFEDKNWWNWAVWLEAPKKELDGVDHVVYTLHSTFSDPVRTVKSRRDGFKLTSAGWGEFEIYIEIVRKSGAPLKRTHWLTLEYPASAKPRATGRSGGTGRSGAARMKRASKRAPIDASEAKAETAAPAAAPESPAKIFISSGSADADVAHDLGERLTERGVTVISANDLMPGEDWERAVKQAINDSDAAVFVVSSQPSLWSSREMSYAAGTKTKSIPLLVGSKTTVPTLLSDSTAVRLNSRKEVGGALDAILLATKIKGTI